MAKKKKGKKRGRKKLPPGQRMVTIAFAVKPDFLKEVDAGAANKAIDRSKYLRDLLSSALAARMVQPEVADE